LHLEKRLKKGQITKIKIKLKRKEKKRFGGGNRKEKTVE